MADRRCLVALCTNWPFVPTQTAQSLMELGWGDRVQVAKESNGFSAIDHAWFKGFPRVDALRDGAAVQAVRDGYSHLLFLDADNVWPHDVLEQILSHADRDVVGGLYVQRGEPYAPVALINGQRVDGSAPMRYWHDLEAVDATELREVQVIGMGCTLIQTGIFQTIGDRPWFTYEPDDHGWPLVSEDVPFCRRAREAGYRVWLDPTIRCGHVNQMVTDARWSRRYQQAQQRTLDTMPIRLRTVEISASEVEG